MRATNGIGYEIQALDPVMGWRREGKVFATVAEARAALSLVTPDGIERRVYEALK